MSVQEGSYNINGLIAFLKEPLVHIRELSIRSLLTTVDRNWPEISKHVQIIEDIAKQTSSETSEMSYFLLSKVYYHLEDYQKSLSYALQAGDKFNTEEESDFVGAMMNTCIAEYKKAMQASTVSSLPPKIVDIVQSIFNKAKLRKEYEKLLGLALTCRRLDIIKNCVEECSNQSLLMSRLMKIIQTTEMEGNMKESVIDLMINLYQSQNQVFMVFQCLVVAKNYSRVAELLVFLLDKYPEASYQMAYDVYSLSNTSVSQQICRNLSNFLKSSISDDSKVHLAKLIKIVDGTESNKLYREFLLRRSHSDEQLLSKLTDNAAFSDEPNIQSALFFTNSLVNIANTNSILATCPPWVKQVKHWNKCYITSALGIPYLYTPEKYPDLMDKYLLGTSAEEKAGSRLSYGIVCMGQPHLVKSDILTDITDTVTNGSQDEMLVHACSLALGLIYTGSSNATVVESLINVISDQPLSGMAAGIAIGLVLVEGEPEDSQILIASQLRPLVQETKHDKIAFGVSLGIALSLYGTRTEGLNVALSLLGDHNAYCRMAGALGLGLAFCGYSSHTVTIQRLLSVISGDVSDFVQRAAVYALGFVFVNSPNEMLPFARLLLASHSAHVRYSTALISGIICAGSGSHELLSLMMPLLDETEDFVVQGASIGCACLLMQCNEELVPEMPKFRAKLMRILEAKNTMNLSKDHSLLGRQGAMLAAGLLDAGGRNCTLSLVSPLGTLRRDCILSVAIAINFWEWFGLFNVMAKALTPTAVLGIDLDHQLRRSFIVDCNCAPIRFDYVQPTELKSKKERERKFDIHFSFLKRSSESKPNSSDAESVAKKAEEEEKKKAEARKIASFEVLNATRVTPLQQQYITVNPRNKWLPVTMLQDISARARVPTGVLVLKDMNPNMSDEVLNLAKDDGLPTPKCPESFIYSIPDEPPADVSN